MDEMNGGRDEQGCALKVPPWGVPYQCEYQPLEIFLFNSILRFFFQNQPIKSFFFCHLNLHSKFHFQDTKESIFGESFHLFLVKFMIIDLRILMNF
jgi:hypothetical protein